MADNETRDAAERYRAAARDARREAQRNAEFRAEWLQLARRYLALAAQFETARDSGKDEQAA